jgi:lysophospholipase
MQLHPSPENPAPPGAECLAVEARDGTVLRAMRAVPENPRGTVVVIGGRGDFAERYFETMRELMARGFAVALVDLRGQGGSLRPLGDPLRSRVTNFKDYEEDIRALMEQAVLPACPPPYIALGHSTGGHVLLRLLRRPGWFSKAVLVSPLVDVLYGTWPRSVAALLVNAMTLAGFGSLYLPGVTRRPLGRADFSGNPLSTDPWRWQRDSATLEEAPELGLGGATFSWLYAARRSLAAVGRMTRVSAPVLIIAAGRDRVVSNEAIRRLARRVPGIALAIVPGAQHEILSERDEFRGQFLAAFDSFVTDVVPEAQVTASPPMLPSQQEVA